MIRLLTRFYSPISFVISSRGITVLGIESSCDDSAVAIVQEDRRILASRNFADRELQRHLGGICPASVAQQHKAQLPVLLDECLFEAGLNFCDIDAIAVTTKPGLVIALKEGIRKAIELARIYHKDLIPVHHMQAHALSAFLVSDDLSFPFLTLLISGGHSLIVLVRSSENFIILGKSLSGSAGECMDKVARELNIQYMDDFKNIHPGAALEILARRCSANGHLRYSIRGPHVAHADMNFSHLKSNFLTLIKNSISSNDFNVEDFCASVQYQVTRHIVAKLHAALEHLRESGQLTPIRYVVVSGGVASNNYITNGISKIAAYYDLQTISIPPSLCTDNAEMIAWTGIQMMNVNSTKIHRYPKLPDTIYAHARFDIGIDERHSIPPKPIYKLKGSTVHGDTPLKLYSKSDFKKVRCKCLCLP